MTEISINFVSMKMYVESFKSFLLKKGVQLLFLIDGEKKYDFILIKNAF